MKCSMLAALLVVLPAAAFAWEKETKMDEETLQGTWLLASAELAGTKLPDEALKVMKLILKDDKYTVKNGDLSDKGTWTLDADKKPKTMDIKGTEGPNKDKTFLAIYELNDEDEVKICYDLSGKGRPTEFKTKPGTQLFLVTYKREKP